MRTRNGAVSGTTQGEEDPPSNRSRRGRGVRVTSAAAVALGLAVAGGSVAGATSNAPSPSTSSGSAPQGNRPPGGGSPPAVVGTVKSVGDGTFTITTQDGTTVTVNVSSSTTYRDHDVTSPSLANVTVGERVAVFGSDNANVVTATGVAIGAPPDGGGPGGTLGGKLGSKPSGAPAASSGSGPPS
jgi:hypothetical protein